MYMYVGFDMMAPLLVCMGRFFHAYAYVYMRVVTWMASGAMGRQGEVGGAGGGEASGPGPGSLPSVVRAQASVVRGAGEGGAGARRVAAWRGEVAQGNGVEGCHLGGQVVSY